MTPEAKAREIVGHLSLTPSTVTPTPVADATNLVAQALRQVRLDALEEAAKVAEEQAEFRGEGGGEIWIASKIASSIRSLVKDETQ